MGQALIAIFIMLYGSLGVSRAAGAPASAPVIGRITLINGGHFTGAISLASPASIKVALAAGNSVTIPFADTRQIIFRAPPPALPATRPTTHPAVRVVSEADVLLNQSSTDALNGNVGYSDDAQPMIGLTDAASRALPTDDIGPFHGRVTWDLGPQPAAESRELNSFSIWISNHYPRGSDYEGRLAVSLDGRDFWEIPGTQRAIRFSMRYSPHRLFNHVVYFFSPGFITNFRYLRFTVDTPISGFDTRLVETDAFIGAPAANPLRVTGLITTGGSHIVAGLESADEDSVQFRAPFTMEKEIGHPAAESHRHILALSKVTRLVWYCMPPANYAHLAPDACGALLRTGDFCDGYFKGLDGDWLNISSVLLGLRQFDAAHEVAAFVLPRGNAAAKLAGEGKFWLRTMDNSAYVGRSVLFDTGGLALDEPSLGWLHFKASELVELDRLPSAVHGSAQPPRN